MSDFATTWELVRSRFDDALKGVTTEQLNWRLHPGSLTLGEMSLHVAGVEVSFISQLKGEELSGTMARVRAAATDGTVNDKPFPFATEEVTAEFVAQVLAEARAMTEPVIRNPDPYRNVTIVSALGPVIDGTGAFARLAYHPGYHQGQAHTIKTAPGFPA